jgi:uncharacterized protein YyaL (SSP411 family)
MMNRLGDSTSLYLRQHADNPVHWQPWDDAALAEARQRDCPILLSIGYSACHWCHVMAHESFEDAATGADMNRLFVNIKVDREERPDLDKLYQLAHQLLSRRGGGWPLTVFLEPQQLVPFFAGTYFPPAPRHGLPGFREVLRRVRDWFDHSRDEIQGLNDQLGKAISAIQQPGEGQLPAADTLLSTAAQAALARHDHVHGGFGGAPKFPQAPLLAALPVLELHDPLLRAAAVLDLTLERMAGGGLRDQLDCGFFRYTVDGDWTIPHFEKMLYDNAQLLPLYAQRSANPWFAEVAAGIVDWLHGAMRQDNGGFSSSIDADADGVEGGFHVWDPLELARQLPEHAWQAAEQAFGLDQPPNFEGRHWHLTRRAGHEPSAALDEAIHSMLALRAQRTPPATDHKQLASWNALAVNGLALAGMAMQREDWVDSAQQCMDFIRREAWREGRLYAVVAAGTARFPAYLDDHAFCLQAALNLLQARWDGDLYLFCLQLAERLLGDFEDTTHGGFFFTGSQHDAPMQRLRLLQDDATPSGNGVAAQALMQLGHLAAEPRYLDTAGRLLESAGTEFKRYPLAHASLLLALQDWHAPPAQVLVSGAELELLQECCRQIRGRRRLNCYAVPAEASTRPGSMPEPPPGDELRAWLCVGMRCLPGVDDLATLEQLLEQQLDQTD